MSAERWAIGGAATALAATGGWQLLIGVLLVILFLGWVVQSRQRTARLRALIHEIMSGRESR